MRLSGKAIVGILLSILLLWWALRDVSFAEVLHELQNADPLLFLLAVAGQTLGMVIRALRWRLLLVPVAPNISFRPRFAAVNIGFAANNVFPARVGEFARAYSLSRLTGIPVTAALGSLVVERLLDGVVLIGFLFAAMAVPTFPAAVGTGGIDPRAAAGVIAVIMGALGVLLFFLVSAPERSVALAEWGARRILPESFRRPLIDGLRSFLTGLEVLRDTRLFLGSVAWAVAQWGFLAISFLLAFRAFGIDEVGFAGALFLQSLIALAVAVPSSPGFFGPYEAAAKLGLALWAVAPQKAVSFAIGFHIGGFIPVTLLGFYYVWRLGLSWREVEKSEQTVEEIVERDTPEPLHEGTPVD
ncbi:lysylphosphatidylglycerol synthase transmembrane domain-containing protein [soil metagenome]|jgi:uncharacterized protein (TIRG00374 family)|nr:flippase-like domain-containing protein [Gemmatimonadota bacterium]